MVILVFLLGTIIGSFLNVCIYRIPRKESIAWPGSHCPECGYVLKWYDLFPVLSFLVLCGKCRQCRSHISWRYPVVEIVTGLVFFALYQSFGLSWSLLSGLVFCSLLIVIGLIDLENLIIPNVLVLPGALVGLAFAFLPGSPSWISGLLSGLGAGLLFLIIWLVYPAGMGEGDIKLALMLGTFLGWPLIGVSVFLASLLGSIAGLAVIAVKGGGRKTPVPFGLYLSIGSILALLYGYQMVDWYLSFIGW